MMLVRGNEYKRSGKKLLMPCGGGMVARSTDREYIQTYLKVEAGEDLRFKVHGGRHFKSLESLFNAMSKERIVGEAQREFQQEMGKERQFLSPKEIASCSFTFKKKVAPFEAESYRHDTWGQRMLYLVGLVDVNAPDAVVNTLTEVSQQEDPMLEFVPLMTIINGYNSAKGSTILPIYHYIR